MNKKKKGLILTVIALIGLIAITAGVTYAFFNYTKQGTTDNTVTTGTITFLYTEVSGAGKGISIKEAYPVSDEVGKAQTGEGKVFDFKITSTTPNKTNIPYEITARKKTVENILDEKAVKMYLTKVSGDNEEEVLLNNYSNLTPSTKVDSSKYTEKTLYTSEVPAGSNKYEQAYRLRMWIDEKTDFSYDEETGKYPYNDKEFTVTVNVYANAKIVTEEDVANESKAEISNLTVEGVEVTKVQNEDYDYEMSLPDGTTETTIDIETDSPNATVKVERLDSLAYETSNIKRLSTKETLELNPGNNYFRITVISENKQNKKEYVLKINVKEAVSILGTKFDLITNLPTLTNSSNNTNDASGLYKSISTNSGEPTYYFRGNVDNNWIDFAGFTWKVVRINEDGTIRIVMNNAINNNATYVINSSTSSKKNMYYSNSAAKTQLTNWYQTNIAGKGYSDDVVTGEYFCEQAKVSSTTSNGTSSGASMIVYSKYVPDFKCNKDANGYGVVNSNIGLLTYDEVVHAGGYYDTANDNYYLYNDIFHWWTMSPAGFSGSTSFSWAVITTGTGSINYYNVGRTFSLRPVVNLKADVEVTGTGASNDHWVVQ